MIIAGYCMNTTIISSLLFVLLLTSEIVAADFAAVPRTDENSRIAHQQLLQKARQGKIDVYFLGDSITRRWGCTDPQWSELLANWKKNFFGWNAADFGWGGDTTHNALWRVENGELDGVDPKVIVLQIGTNDIGSRRYDDAEAAAKVEEVTQGVKAILAICQAKAPHATILLTGIFPRNDNPTAGPIIHAINENLGQLANADRIRFININGGLADRQGHLRDEMTVDGLHLTARGCQVWADALKPHLAELLGPPADEDHAPPPTGDPSLNR
jgi:lysophospholipase L1-like esterase